MAPTAVSARCEGSEGAPGVRVDCALGKVSAPSLAAPASASPDSAMGSQLGGPPSPGPCHGSRLGPGKGGGGVIALAGWRGAGGCLGLAAGLEGCQRDGQRDGVALRAQDALPCHPPSTTSAVTTGRGRQGPGRPSGRRLPPQKEPYGVPWRPSVTAQECAGITPLSQSRGRGRAAGYRGGAPGPPVAGGRRGRAPRAPAAPAASLRQHAPHTAPRA